MINAIKEKKDNKESKAKEIVKELDKDCKQNNETVKKILKW